LAHVYHADCQYDLQNYDEAVRLYERVVDRYEKDQIALAAYLQIINAYQRQGRLGKIKAVLERMKWQLRQLPDSAFSGPGVIFSRDEWRSWIEWNYGSGILARGNADLAAPRANPSSQF